MDPSRAGLFARFVFRYSKRKYGRVLDSLPITAHSSALFRGAVDMEKAQQRLHAVDPKLVALAEIKAATIIGCPY